MPGGRQALVGEWKRAGVLVPFDQQGPGISERLEVPGKSCSCPEIWEVIT